MDSIKLKYTFELAAIRDSQEYMDKTSHLAFDLASYAAQLYAQRIQDKQLFEQVQKELAETKQKLATTEERLSLLENPIHQHVLLGHDDDAAHEPKHSTTASHAKRGVKRKGGTLAHPAEKRQARAKGAQIK